MSLSAPMTLPADGTASVSFTASTYEFIIYALVALPNVRADLYDASGTLTDVQARVCACGVWRGVRVCVVLLTPR